MKYASIVPLIGGATIAMQNVLQRKPDYIISYDDFKAPNPRATPHACVGAEVKIIIIIRHQGRFWTFKATQSRQ